MKHPSTFFLLLFVCLVTSLPARLLAEEQQRLIAVQGEAKIELEPNRAIVALQIKQTRNTLEEARQGVGASLKKVVAVLSKHGINNKNIEKTQIWQGPNQLWENNKQVQRGYIASLQLKVTLDNLEQLASLADDLSKIEDATLQSTGFTRSDIESLQREQRKLALLNAKQKAGDMLAVYDAKLGPVLTIRDSGSPEPIVYGAMAMKTMGFADSAAPEPAAWAKVTVSASVQVEFVIQ